MKPNELLPDEVDSITINGVIVRKGTIGAFIQNALILTNSQISARTQKTVEADLLELLPSIRALQVFDVFEIRNPQLRKLIEARQR